MARQPHPRQRALIAVVTAARQRAGLNQRDLATRLGRAHSFIGKIEVGAQQLKVLEFCDLAEAVGVDPSDLLRQVLTWRGMAP